MVTIIQIRREHRLQREVQLPVRKPPGGGERKRAQLAVFFGGNREITGVFEIVLQPGERGAALGKPPLDARAVVAVGRE